MNVLNTSFFLSLAKFSQPLNLYTPTFDFCSVFSSLITLALHLLFLDRTTTLLLFEKSQSLISIHLYISLSL